MSFSTMGMPADVQFNAWRDHCISVVDITSPPGSSSGYAATLDMWNFGHFTLSAVTAPPTVYRRTKTHIRRDSLDHWLVYVARSGTRTGAQPMRPRAPRILSLDQPFDGQRTGPNWLCLFVSRDAFPGLGPTIDSCRAAPLTTAMGWLLGSYLESLAANLATMTESELPRAAEATRALLAACVTAASPATGDAEVHVEQARLGRIRQLIRQNLRSTRLGPERLCKLAGVSRSQLYRLFEPFGGVARYIQSERLRQAHQALSDPTNSRDIIKIAEDLGFFDPSAFSRAFRREFDYSPTQLRLTAQSGWVAAPIRKIGFQTMARDFAGALRQI